MLFYDLGAINSYLIIGAKKGKKGKSCLSCCYMGTRVFFRCFCGWFLQQINIVFMTQ